MSLIDKVGFT